MNKKDMIMAEMNSIIKEVFEDTDPAEQIMVTLAIAAVQNYLDGMPLRHRRLTFEVLYKYYALIEGLKK